MPRSCSQTTRPGVFTPEASGSYPRADEPLCEAAKPIFVLTLPLELQQGFTRTCKQKKPLPLCPTLNVFSSMPNWLKKKVREAVDFKIAEAFGRQHGNEYLGAGLLLFQGKFKCTERRRVVVTRHSSREPDELAVDVIGGKIPIDRLVKLGILAGDSRKWLEREARWVYAPPKAGKLVIEVYEVET